MSMMLTAHSGNPRDGIELQSGLQGKGDFNDEFRKLESVIETLASIQESSDQKNEFPKNRNRSFGFKKLGRLRMSKKNVASGNAETKEDVKIRIKKLQSLCKDFRERLKEEEDEHYNSPKMESRDDDISSTGKRDDEVERVEGDPTEILEAIVACAEVLSKFSVDPKLSKHSREYFNISSEEIEVTESKFLEADEDSKTREEFLSKFSVDPEKSSKHSRENLKKSSEEIEVTESKFVEADKDSKTREELKEKVEKLIQDIEITESKFLETDTDKETLTRLTDVAEIKSLDTIGHIKTSNYWIIEAIEDILTSLDYFCGISQLWDITQVEEAVSDENSTQSKKEAVLNSVTSTAKSNFTEHPKNLAKCSTEDPQIETAQHLTTHPKNQTDENPEEADTMNENSNKENLQKQEESLENEDEIRISSDCDIFYSLCLLTTTNAETETVKNLDKEDEAETSLDCDVFNSLCAKTEVTKNANNMDEVVRSLENAFMGPLPSIETHTVAFTTFDDTSFGKDGDGGGDALQCGFLNSLGSFTKTYTETNDARSNNFAGSNEQHQNDETATKAIDEQCCMPSSIKAMNEIQEFMDVAFQPVGSNEVTEKRSINTVSTMDLIPRIEVVGFKLTENETHDAINSREKISGVMGVTEKEESTEKTDQRQIVSVSTMDFIPRLEVVGFKSKNSAWLKNESLSLREERDDARQSQNRKHHTASREGKTVTKKQLSKGKVLSSKNRSETRTQKVSQRERRRKAAKKRREQRRLKHHLIQEAPDRLEHASNDPINAKTKCITMCRETPETLVRKSVIEVPPPPIRNLPDNLEVKKNHSRKEFKALRDVRKARNVRQQKEARHDSTTRQAPFEEYALINSVTSSLSTWTGNKSSFMEINFRRREDNNDGVDYKNRQKAKPWFFQRLQEEDHCEIIESLSPVFSIPIHTQSTFGSNDEDDEYVNHYYDFGDDDDRGTYADDYEYNHGYEDEYIENEADRNNNDINFCDNSTY